MRQQHPPAHPGLILKENYLYPHNLGITELGDLLKVSRKCISQLVNGHMGISPEMALKLAKVFATSPEFWLTLQLSYDLFIAKKKLPLKTLRSIKTMKTYRKSNKVLFCSTVN